MDAGPPAGEMSSPSERTAANRSVDRACKLLLTFTFEQPAFALGELSRRIDLPKATVHRLASVLLARGLLAQAPDGRYELGVKMLEFGSIVRESLDSLQLCRPAIEALAEASGETVLLAEVDWSAREMLLLARRDSQHPLTVGSPVVGRRQPIPPGGALGKAVLAGLPINEAAAVISELPLVPATPKTPIERRRLLRDVAQARKVGYAAEQDEYMEGVAGVAVPVIFEAGRPRAAIGVVGPTTRLSSELTALGVLLLDATEALRPASAPRGLHSAG